MATVLTQSEDRYSKIYQEIKTDHELLVKDVKRFVNSARQRIPDLCNALKEKEENGLKLSFQEIRDRIYRDCSQFWEKETIRSAFPEWMKIDATPLSDDLVPQGFMPFGNSGMMIPVEDKKYYNQQIEETILLIKRNFRQIIKESENAKDVQKAFNDYCYANQALKNVKYYIENIGKNYKMTLVNPITDMVKPLRKPISVYNLNFPMHEDYIKYCDSIREKIDLYKKQLDNLVDGLYKYPIYTLNDIREMDFRATSLLIESYQAVNFKSSQTLDDMFATDKKTDTMTEKVAGKSSKTRTLVCKKCLKKFDAEKNDDPPIMQIDRGSPTGFRCPECLGMEMVDRGLTKDIVIQRKPFLEKISDHIKKHPSMGFFSIYGKAVKEVLTGTRKALASELLKQSKFGSTNSSFNKI
jgi:hypothetical protein